MTGQIFIDLIPKSIYIKKTHFVKLTNSNVLFFLSIKLVNVKKVYFFELLSQL